MAWSERQAAMLKEMGLRVDVRPAELAVPVAQAVLPQAVGSEVASRSPGPAPRPVAPGRTAAAPSALVQPPVQIHTPRTVVSRRAGGNEIAREDIAAMDWPELRSAVASCTACKLCEGRTKTVFGVGQVNAHWMVVGEAPGEQEDAQGEPFVGKSGQLLDNMLRALGLSREAHSANPSKCAYIANSVKCRPPGNRNPAADELAQCEPYLMRQVALVQPKIILAMGRFAVQSLLRSTDPIGKLRGRVHHYQGVPLIVTYHPAYLLRNLEEKARAWDDLCLAAQTYDAQLLLQRSP
jgi:uracil-DNA glycosylase